MISIRETRACALALCLVAAGSSADAQSAIPDRAIAAAAASSDAAYFAPNEPAPTAKTGKVLHALRISGAPPRIDGTLNDEIWARAEAAGNYVQWDPDNGEPS